MKKGENAMMRMNASLFRNHLIPLANALRPRRVAVLRHAQSPVAKERSTTSRKSAI